MSEFGFKKLTVENWMLPEEMLKLLVTLTDDLQLHPISGNEWARRILTPQLAESVPLEIRKLFEVARGVMLYGFFFYPLYALGIGQMCRVAESAISFKCKVMGARAESIPTFKHKIDWLVKKSVLTSDEGRHWHDLRVVRNESSHPSFPALQSPHDAVVTASAMATQINSLFTM